MLSDHKLTHNKVDVLLVGGGVMSATLGSLLSQLAPSLQMLMVERQDSIATESTDAWNNAGTGHAGYCELNYTPQLNDGNIEIRRALEINAAFEASLQYWSSLVKQQGLPAPQGFINKTPHESFVWGEKDVAFLKARHQLLKQHHLFADMVFSESPEQMAAWMPLVMQGRTPDQPMAATHVAYGADVDFGALTRHLVANLKKQQNFSLLCGQQVRSLKQQRDGRWQVSLIDTITGKRQRVEAGFVFLGAGGAALPLLQSSGIAESRGYGGFPVSGQWLVCQNPDVVVQHGAKVYGKAPLGAPPMSVPHLDTRYIQGQPALLFGPFAGFSSKFLKQGSYLDLLRSVKAHNLSSLLGVARHHMELTRYLIGEVLQSHDDRMLLNGAWQRPGSGYRLSSDARIKVVAWNLVPRLWHRQMVPWPHCWAHPPAHQFRCRPCSMCCSVAFLSRCKRHHGSQSSPISSPLTDSLSSTMPPC